MSIPHQAPFRMNCAVSCTDRIISHFLLHISTPESMFHLVLLGPGAASQLLLMVGPTGHLFLMGCSTSQLFLMGGHTSQMFLMGRAAPGPLVKCF